MSKQIYENGKAYVETQGQKQEVPKNLTKEVEREAQLFPELSYLNNDEVKLMGIEKVDGEDAYVLSFSEI